MIDGSKRIPNYVSVPGRPIIVKISLAGSGILLILQTTLLFVHFLREALRLKAGCHPISPGVIFELALGLIFMQIAVPVLLLTKISLGRNWARFAYSISLIVVELLLIKYGYEISSFFNIYIESERRSQLINTYYILHIILLILSGLLFTPGCNRWFGLCNKNFERESKRPWIVTTGLTISGLIVSIQILFDFWGNLFVASFKSFYTVGMKIVENCAPPPMDLCCVWPNDGFAKLWIFIVSVQYQTPLQLFLLFQIAAGRPWSRPLYAAALTVAVLYYIIAFVENTDGTNPPGVIADLAAELMLVMSGALFVVAPSNRWFKARVDV